MSAHTYTNSKHTHTDIRIEKQAIATTSPPPYPSPATAQPYLDRHTGLAHIKRIISVASAYLERADSTVVCLVKHYSSHFALCPLRWSFWSKTPHGNRKKGGHVGMVVRRRSQFGNHPQFYAIYRCIPAIRLCTFVCIIQVREQRWHRRISFQGGMRTQADRAAAVNGTATLHVGTTVHMSASRVCV